MKVVLKLSSNSQYKEMVLSRCMPYLMFCPLKRNLNPSCEWETPLADLNWVLLWCVFRQFLY